MASKAFAEELLHWGSSKIVLEPSPEHEPQRADDMATVDPVPLAVPSTRPIQKRYEHSAERERDGPKPQGSQEESAEENGAADEDSGSKGGDTELFDKKRNGHSFAPARHFIGSDNSNIEPSKATRPPPLPRWLPSPRQPEETVESVSARLQSPRRGLPLHPFRLLGFLRKRRLGSSTTTQPSSSQPVQPPMIFINGVPLETIEEIEAWAAGLTKPVVDKTGEERRSNPHPRSPANGGV